MTAAFGDDSAAAGGEPLEIFLHLVPNALDFPLCSIFGGQGFGRIVREDEDGEVAVRAGMDGFLAGLFYAARLAEGGS